MTSATVLYCKFVLWIYITQSNFRRPKKKKNEVRDLSQKSNRIWMNNKHLSLKFQKKFEASKDGVHRYPWEKATQLREPKEDSTLRCTTAPGDHRNIIDSNE